MFTLTTDSAVDVFRSELDKLGVYWVPLTYAIDGVTYEDDFSDDARYKDFYEKVRAGAMPVTSQINPFAHEEFWEKVVEKTGPTDIVHLTLSSGLSETYSSACKAAESFMSKHPDTRIYVVDSLSATQAEMPVFEMALRLRGSGGCRRSSQGIYSSHTGLYNSGRSLSSQARRQGERRGCRRGLHVQDQAAHSVRRCGQAPGL